MLWDSWRVCLFLILVFWTEWAVLSQNWHTYRFHLVWVCLFNFKSFSFHKTHLHIWVIEKLIDFFFFTTLNILFLIHKAFHSPYWIKISQGEELTVPTWTKASLMGTIHLNHYFFIFGPLCCTFLFWNKNFPPSKSKLQDFLLHFLLFHAQKQKRLPDGTMKPYWALIARPRQVVGAAVRKSTRFSLKINLRTKKDINVAPPSCFISSSSNFLQLWSNVLKYLLLHVFFILISGPNQSDTFRAFAPKCSFDSVNTFRENYSPCEHARLWPPSKTSEAAWRSLHFCWLYLVWSELS